MFTRYGDVTPLLLQADNMFVVFGPGDELKLRFDGRRLPRLPAGWHRDFIFYANGWVKDGDLNTALSQRVEPLPFHGMSGYPYPAGEHYPQTPELQRYLRVYNTRPSAATTGRLVRGKGARDWGRGVSRNDRLSPGVRPGKANPADPLSRSRKPGRLSHALKGSREFQSVFR
jgi:hypothetical protein